MPFRKHELKQSANFSGDLKYAMYYDYEYFVYDEEQTLLHNNVSNINDTIFIPNLPLFTVVAQISHGSISEAIKLALESKFIISLLLNCSIFRIYLFGDLTQNISTLTHNLAVFKSPIISLLYAFLYYLA